MEVGIQIITDINGMDLRGNFQKTTAFLTVMNVPVREMK